MARKRNLNIEILRIVAMIMIIVLHGLDKGRLLRLYFGNGNAAFLGSWVLESFAIAGLNMYMLITGYFMVSGRLRSGRLLEIILTVLYYSVGIITVLLLLFKVIGFNIIGTFTLNDLFKCVLPLHMESYWFCTAYVVFYLFLPVLAVGVKNMGKKALLITIILLLIFETAFKSVLPVTFEIDDKGYSALWFITLFLVAAYIRLYGIKFFKDVKRGVITYVVCSLLILIEELSIQLVYAKTGHLELLERISYDYNHVFVLLGSVGLFTAFVNAKEREFKAEKVISAFATGSFGVYLIHEHVFLRFKWPEWLGITGLSDKNPVVLVLWVIAAAVMVYIVCACLDMIRQQIFKTVEKASEGKKVSTFLTELDKKLNGEI
ncbi:MAG: acyltransferase [Lachnospiraceae bacterium]|nr:acyltransferase [Lachnospiraceae bacterium]